MDELSFYDGAYTGQEIDSAIGKVRNPDTTPTASSFELVTSGGVKAALTGLESDLAAIHATGTTNTTGAAISSGTYFYLNGALVQAKEYIDSGQSFTSGTNYEAVTAGGLNSLNAALPKIKSKDYTVTFVQNSYVQPYVYRTDIFYDSFINKNNVFKVSISITTIINATFWNDRISICSYANLGTCTLTVYYFE